ncbi:MAG: pyridoxine 5'-phosphate synthase [SAR86 cluster bacterium]|uniref:Pyridoxine 5'-phosphate synthase n=1 Tax=SAR86 cluster bacterium TaxID=2030880 RepID=A0A2A4WW94_9GAMM|nr:MAG: pyridoxine 5'-phosphate synthase [SAR86 cluster bacterium]
MTVLSVNVNKIALLRNSRGRDFPSVVGFSEQLIELGVKGITVHPRPDERHITRRDVYALSELLKDKPQVEFNIEGYPSEDFMKMALEVCPDQCTLVPDSPGQLTSDHGWNILQNQSVLQQVLSELRNSGIRSSLFLDPDTEMVDHVTSVAADRIELYTEDFASHYGSPEQESVFERYRAAAARAGQLGIGINAGHDLDLQNLAQFLQIPNILEVSIGHALVVESLQMGVAEVIERYLAIVDRE